MSDDLSLNDKKAVQQLLEQRKQEALFMNWIDKIEKNKKEKRLLVVATDRIFSVRPGGKIAREGHLLELVEIISNKPGEVHLNFKGFKLPFVSDQADEIIHTIRTALASAFYGMPEKQAFKIDVTPTSRLRDVSVAEPPLGGFINTYKSICNLNNNDCRDDICWDMENLFIPGNIKEFNLREFEQPISLNDFKALFGALQYNNYFRTLVAKELNLDKNMTQWIADVLKTNNKIEELILIHLGINKDGINIISDNLILNKFITLSTINLSGNQLEDKGLQSLSNWIGNLHRGLVSISLSNVSGGKSGCQAICSALKKNVHFSSTLLYLDISHNKLETDGSSALASFLATPNSIKKLNISSTVANLDLIINAIVRGCNELQTLDVSGNKLTKKETTTLCKYLTATATLNNLNLSNTTIPIESIKDILTSIGSNLYLKDCVINIAENKIGIPGARVIASLTDKIHNIIKLDLSDNELLDEGLGIITEGLQYNTSIKQLILDRNYRGKQQKIKTGFIEGVIILLNSDCPIETLSIAGGLKSELKLDILPLLAVLGTNDTLLSIDISGNQIGNKGASALGKMLQTNDTLTTLLWDNNGTTISGFASFAIGLKRNYTLKIMPMPIQDISNAFKEANNKSFLDVMNKIESSISRNQNPTARFQKDGLNNNLDSNASQFAFLNSGQREEVQKLLFKIKSTGRQVQENKKVVINDASNQDQVMANLFNIKDQIAASFEHEMKSKLVEFVTKTYPIYGQLKNKLIEQVTELVKKSYNSLDEEVVRRLVPNLTYGGAKEISQEEFERALVEVAGVELTNKASQAYHSLCTIASDYLYEKLQDQLRDIADEITNEIQLEQQKREDEEAAKKAQQTGSKDKPKTTTAAPAKKPPAKSPPPPPSTRPPVNKSTKQEPEVKIEELPKAESNLNHMTKDRPMVQQKRKPPTRKPRPVHNPDKM